MLVRAFLLCSMLAVLLLPHIADAQPERSLEKCQRAILKEGARYTSQRTKFIGACLQRLTKEIIAENELSLSGATGPCISRLRKIENSADPSKTFAARFDSRISQACDPDINGALAHGSGDILGDAPSVLEAIQANNLDG